jgi:hypothetical protein
MNRAPLRDGLSFCRLLALLLVPVSLGQGACTTATTTVRAPALETEPAPPRLNAQQETKRVTDIIEGSKPAPADVTAKLKDKSDNVLKRSFAGLFSEKLIVGTPTLDCFTEGCLYRVVFTDRCAQLRADALFFSERTLPLLEWPGSVGRTPPITGANGQVSVTWTLYLTPAQYPQLDKIPRSDAPTPLPVPPCPRQGGTSPAGVAPKTAPEAK